MREVPLLFAFGLCFFFALFAEALFPAVKLIAFAPFLALLYTRTSWLSCLWISSLCGLIIDLFNCEMRLGVFALNFCLTTLLLYRQKQHFFEDKALSLCLFTGLVSGVSTLIQWLLRASLGPSLPFSKRAFFIDLFLMPWVDMLYALLFLCAPMLLYAHIKKIGWRAFYKEIRVRLRLQRAQPHDPD